MTLESKATQPQTLFTVWTRKSSTNRNSDQYLSPTSAPIETATGSTTTIDHTSIPLVSNLN